MIIDRHTVRLWLTYLGLIMAMSLMFSFAFYRTSTRAINRQIPPDSFYERGSVRVGAIDFDQFFQDRATATKHELIQRLIGLNLTIFALGSLLSYLLARRSLEPIEQALDAQARFSSDAAHELRTPLTAIRTKNEVALRKPKLSSKEAKAVIESNLKEAIKLQALSEGLLKLTVGGPIEKKKVQATDVVSQAINSILPGAQSKQISIEDNVGKMVLLGDETALVQAITIILDNAVKFSPSGEEIKISSHQRGRQGYIAVSDQGTGIRATDLPHIFDRFYRADQSRTKQNVPGYGLGLSIAKNILEQHSGGISVKSRLGAGSTFEIHLPLAS